MSNVALISQQQGVVRNKLKAVFLVLIWLFFSFAASYQWFGEGRDYSEYLRFYSWLKSNSFWTHTRFEPGYTFLAWVFKFYLGTSYSLFYLVLVSLALGLKLHLIWRYTTSPVLATLVYLMLFYPLHEYTQIRVAVAIGFAYLALHKGLQGKIYNALILFFLALIFHYSVAVLVVGACLFFFLRQNIYLFASGVVLSLMLLAFIRLQFFSTFLYRLNPLTSAYIKNSSTTIEPNLLSLSFILFGTTLVSISFDQRPWRDDYTYLWFFLSIIGMVSFVLLNDSPVFAHRIKEIFMVSSIFLTFKSRWLSLIAPIPAMLMIMNGMWFLYRAIEQGII